MHVNLLETLFSTVTEYDYKRTLPGFAALAAQAAWKVKKVWTDDCRWFSVQYLTTR